uniref:Uncharacterized protein n=1 Tax=Oryza glumipatula TaxID=40148 RepID=A0A0D9Z8V8_9ORYZ
MAFASLISSDDFTCTMETNTSAIRCRGPRGGAMEAGFLNASISTLGAGGSRVCGVRKNDGGVRCSGGGVLAPSKDLYMDGAAVGDSHACGLLRPNHTATCWSLGGATTRSTTRRSARRSSSSSPVLALLVDGWVDGGGGESAADPPRRLRLRQQLVKMRPVPGLREVLQGLRRRHLQGLAASMRRAGRGAEVEMDAAAVLN